MLLIALFLAAAPASTSSIFATSASAPAAESPVNLTTEAQVKELCALLRDSGEPSELDPAARAEARRTRAARRDQALQKSYLLEVPAKGFAFGQYRREAQQLELDGDRPLRALGGALLLDLDGIDDVAFNATPAQVGSWASLKKSSSLRLVVTFRPHGERCAGSAAAHAFRLAAAPGSWQLIDSQGTVVASAGPEGEPVDQGPSPDRSVRVEKVVLEDEVPTPNDEGRARLLPAQAALDRCAQAAPRPGQMVIAFAVQAGRIQDPQVIMDALRDEASSRCVARALTGISLAGAGGASGRGTASLALE